MHEYVAKSGSYPLITLSTRAQVEKKKAQTGTLAAAKRIIDREGVIGLYAGLESALFGITVTNFVYYYCMARTVQRDILSS
jgi:solute carrier family 25 (peroxisomal adenine nucleotide transporter), member 17